MDVNIRVAVRCRPLSGKEIARGCHNIVEISDKAVKVFSADSAEEPKTFTYDHCYDISSTQEQVYEDLGKNIVSQGLEGYNGTIFAYGQTGSGKTHTMMGNPDSLGIVPRISADLFTTVLNRLQSFVGTDREGTKCMITVSYLEIYNETIKDLLNPSDKVLKIHESPKNGIYVKDLCELIVKNSSDLLRLLEQGNTVRRVAATNMNEQSSRSHSCFTIKIEQKLVTELSGGVTREQVVSAKLNLVDLAGSERASKTGATGSTLKEGAKINLSLMTLGTVINALAAGGSKGHIPYRDSQLTRLLQESLGGNAATVMIAAISPADYNYEETLGTLKYANRAKSIENQVVRNEDVNERMIRELKEQIEKLKAELSSSATVGGGAPDPELEARLRLMEEDQRNAWEEKERLSQALAAERQSNMNNVISNMMRDLKEQKIEHMKKIKLLTIEKADLVKSQKVLKEKSDGIKAILDKKMTSYNNLKGQYEECRPAEGDDEQTLADKKIKKSQYAQEMQTLLSEVETQKAKWIEKKDGMKVIRSKIAQTEENIDSAKADLVVAHGLLDQNDKLRQRIHEEERMKARDQIAKELNDAKAKLENERQAVRGSIEAEVANEIAQIRKELEDCQSKLSNTEEEKRRLFEQNEELREYSEKLESRLADAEALHESAETTIANLQKEVKEKDHLSEELAKAARDRKDLLKKFELDMIEVNRIKAEETEAKLSTQLRSFEDQKYVLFKSLMDNFSEERLLLEAKNKDFQKLLNQATKDIIFLSQQNDDLHRRMTDMAAWEPEIIPTRAPKLK